MSESLAAGQKTGGSVYMAPLDGLRFFAFLFVFMHHLRSERWLGSWPIIQDFVRLGTRSGWLGVDFFFVLSGFLITFLLETELAQNGRIDGGRFMMRRTLRIWPLYFFSLAAGFILIPWMAGMIPTRWHDHLVSNHAVGMMVFLGNWSAAVYGFAPQSLLSPLWSVSMEEQFYILTMMIFLGARRWRLPITCILCLCSLLLRVALVSQVDSYFSIYLNTFCRMDSFFAGAILAYFYRILSERDSLQNVVKRVLIHRTAPFAVGALVFACLVTADIDGRGARALFTNSIGYSMYAAASCFVILTSIFNPALVRFFSFGPFVYLGKISYGLYVYHFLVIQNCVRFDLIETGYGLIPLSLVTIAAMLSYHLFELPFLKLKRRFEVLRSRPL